MEVVTKFLTINQYSRPGNKLKDILGIVLHWTGEQCHDALTVWNYFENDCPAIHHYSSAHYIIAKDGTIYYCIPTNEKAYHVGSSQYDPESGQIYTDKARKYFGKYAKYYETLSPNNCTIGIEMCAIDENGTFSEATLKAATQLVNELTDKFSLTKERVFTHNEIVGWKDCPRLWTNEPDLFEAFKKTLDA
jgi:N-acetylmuramoyl-L-alanine amidase